MEFLNNNNNPEKEGYTVKYDGKVIFTVKREPGINMFWAARDTDGKMVDKDRYRNDLFERLELNNERVNSIDISV